MKDHEILKPFDGILFSAPIHMAKPDQEIYEYFFRKFDLNPSECFFIDDLEKISRERKMPVWTESSLPVISRQ